MAGKPSKPHLETIRTSLSDYAPEVAPAKLNLLWLSVLNEMLLLFYPPFRAETEHELSEQVLVGLRAYIEDLVEFDGKTLRDAWKDVRRNHKVERWPTSGDLRRACLEISPRAPTSDNAEKPRGDLDAKKERYAEAMAMADAERSRQMVTPLWKQACREGWVSHLLSEISRRLNIFQQHHINGKHTSFAIFFQSHEIDCIRSGSAYAVSMAMDNPISFPEDWAFQIGTETRRTWQDIAAEKDVVGEDGEMQSLSSYAGNILQAVKSGKPLRFEKPRHVNQPLPELSP